MDEQDEPGPGREDTPSPAASFAGLSTPLAQKIEQLRTAESDRPPGVELVYSLSSRLGPFCVYQGAVAILELPRRQALDHLRHVWRVLAMQSSEGRWLYPVFQFDLDQHRVQPELSEVLPLLRDTERWSAGLWLTDPHPDLGDMSPLEALVVDQNVELVQELARQYRAIAGRPPSSEPREERSRN